MRSILLLLCFLSFQTNASFTVTITDGGGSPVEDAVLSFQAHKKANANPNMMPVAIMDQIGMQFEPHVLIVNKNQLVSFPNSDDTRHHVYSFSKPKVFELKLFKGTNSDPVAMDTSGIVELGCNIHDQMLGFIYVDDTGTASKTDSNGQVSFEQNVPDTISVWHPRLNHAKGRQIEFSLDKGEEKNIFRLILDLKAPRVNDIDSGFKRKFKNKFSGPES